MPKILEIKSSVFFIDKIVKKIYNSNHRGGYMSIIQRNEQNLQRFYTYVEQYKHLYPKDAINFIKENFGGDIACDILLQVYAKLGLLETKENIYLEFFNKINICHGLTKNIYEIGCGFYPILTEYIDKDQTELGDGSVTGFDPYVVIENIGKAKLIKAKFEVDYINTKVPDLLVSLAPCESTIPIIEYANRYRIPFSYALCGCNHTTGVQYSSSVSDWHNYVYKIAKATLDTDAELEIDQFDESFNYPYPILQKTYKKGI